MPKTICVEIRVTVTVQDGHRPLVLDNPRKEISEDYIKITGKII